MERKTAMLLLAIEAEEMEVVTTVDILRRAGIDVTIASITDSLTIKCSRGVKIVADCKLDEIQDQDYDVVILPGGLVGSKELGSSPKVGNLLKKQEEKGKIIAAICAAPTALKSHQIFVNKKITSYPAMEKELSNDYEYLQDDVVIDGNLITSRGPGTVHKFAFAIAEKLLGKSAVLPVAKGMLFKDYE